MGLLTGLAYFLAGIAVLLWDLGLKWIIQAVIFTILIIPPVVFIFWMWNRFLQLNIKWKMIFCFSFFLFNTLYEPNGVFHPLMGIGNEPSEQLLILKEYTGGRFDYGGNYIPVEESAIGKWFNNSMFIYLAPVYRFANRVALAGLFVPYTWMGIIGYYTFLALVMMVLFGSYRRNIVNGWGLLGRPSDGSGEKSAEKA